MAVATIIVVPFVIGGAIIAYLAFHDQASHDSKEDTLPRFALKQKPYPPRPSPVKEDFRSAVTPRGSLSPIALLRPSPMSW